jgi:CBS domain containing-hemolysin-like protein
LVYLAIVGPLVRVFDSTSSRMLRSIGIEPVEELDHGATAEELTRIIDESHAGGLLHDDLSEALEGGLRFRELDAADVMTPRVRVTTIGAEATIAELIDLFDTGHSRFPVTGRDRDDIVGVAGIAEVLAVPADDRGHTLLGEVVAPPTVVPTSARLPQILEQLRTEHRQLAVVIDEHGGFAGVVTFEDIAEEVVGEILDEDDAPDVGIISNGTNTWLVPASSRLDEFETITGLELQGHDEFATLSGLVLEALGRTAAVGDVVDVPAHREARGAVDDSAVGRGRRKHELTARLTVTETDRHVPALVEVEVLDLMTELKRLVSPDSDAPNAAGSDGGQG